MIRLTAIVDGKPFTLLTGETVDEAERSCRDRFCERFEGFEGVTLEVRAQSAWSRYRDKKMTRRELEAWLSEQGDDEQAIRDLFNRQRQTRQ